MQIVSYAGRPAALCGRERAIFLAPFSLLERDHPQLRFLAAMCLWAADVEGALEAGIARRYDDRRAERFARSITIPDREIAAAPLSDAELAERLNVPLEQIAAKRRDMAERLQDIPPCA